MTAYICCNSDSCKCGYLAHRGPKEPELEFEDAPHLGLGISYAPKQHAYDYMYKGIRIDPYRIFVEYEITHPAQQHSIKKLLRAGRSVKTLKEDIEESIKTLERWLSMIEEDDK